jgi:hypothetical protein
MLQVTQDILDISQYLEQKFEPATLIQREKGRWLSRDVPIGLPPDPEKYRADWVLCKEGEYIRVPLFPYCSRCDDPCVALGYAFEIGSQGKHLAEEHLKERFGHHTEISRLHISVGHPVEEQILQGQPVLRFWLGCAYRFEEFQ